MINTICNSYSQGDDATLLKALSEFTPKLVEQIKSLGVDASLLQLQENQPLIPILNKLEADAEVDEKQHLAFLAGSISGFINCLELIAGQNKANAASARFGSGISSNSQEMIIRSAILQCTYSEGGVSEHELVEELARVIKVEEKVVREQLQILEDMQLVERLKSDKDISLYRIASLGEEVRAILTHSK